MVAEGVEPALIENAAKQLGFPLGPLQLVDETSIDLGVKIAKATKAALGDAYPESPADDVLFALADQGRLGRKAKAGFYAYDDKGKRTGLWPGLADRWPPRPDQPPLTEVQQRLAMIQTLEAVRALEEGVLTDIREGDVGAILGWGFMPWSGGPFSWLDILGVARGGRDRRPPRRRPRRRASPRPSSCARWRRSARASTAAPAPPRPPEPRPGSGLAAEALLEEALELRPRARVRPLAVAVRAEHREGVRRPRVDLDLVGQPRRLDLAGEGRELAPCPASGRPRHA